MNRVTLLAAAATAASLASSPASATIIDIGAADSTGVSIVFTPGIYRFEWVGIADGGTYDAANGIAVCQGCATGFSNALTILGPDFGSADYTVDFYTTRSIYGSAAASLAAYKAGTSIFHDWAHFVNGQFFNAGSDGLVSFPLVGDPDDGTYRFLVLDFDGTRTNNTGGVSFSVTRVGDAVPEPSTWAMLIAGFGMVGAAMRRRGPQKTRVNYSFA